MKKCAIFLLFILVFSSTVSLFAGGNRETPMTNNAYLYAGGAIPVASDFGGFAIGLGYEHAFGSVFALGAYAGLVTGDMGDGYDFLLKPRIYPAGAALEKFFLGANVGLGHSDFTAGLNLGYKIVFGDKSWGISLEPSLGYDVMPLNSFDIYAGRFNIGVALGYAFGGAVSEPAPAPPPAPIPVAAPRKAETGLYLGIIGFNETLSVRKISILNSGNKSQFQQFITNLKIGPATGLYHAVDNAVTMLVMEKEVLPDDLEFVSIVTFTDGLDNISIELNKNYSTRDSFRDGLQSRIASTKIKGLPIDATSVGIQGGDVRDQVAFRAGLMALASPNSANPLGRSVYFSKDMTEVNAAFSNIAKELNKRSQLQSIRLRITGGYDDGTRIRFTFDNVTDRTIGNSNIYIEGTYRRVGNNRSLENVVYRGLNSTSGTTIRGQVTGTFVYFNFENVTTNSGDLVEIRRAQQWEYLSSMSLWQRNSEFNPQSDSETKVDRKSAVIVLVLDCTTSLTAGGANGFEEMKAAANTFINTLTENN